VNESAEPERSASPWAEIARAAARGAQAEEASQELRQLLVFRIGETPYAVPVDSVREIVRIRPITSIPRVVAHVRGVIALRGEVIQVIDLPLRLGLSAATLTRSSRIVVVSSEEGQLAGILVDAVIEVMRVSDGEFLPSSGSELGLVESLCARGESFVSLIDLQRVMDVDSEH
jgi:purine-binding chemotaxis protein CheW